jgi:hypothetical protein
VKRSDDSALFSFAVEKAGALLSFEKIGLSETGQLLVVRSYPTSAQGYC